MRTESPRAAASRREVLVFLAVGFVLFVLVSISIPGSGPARLSRQNQALQQTKGIFYALKMFATDHNGRFPSVVEEDYEPIGPYQPLQDANHAYANLIPRYTYPRVFSVPSSAYCQTASGKPIPPNDPLPDDRSKILPAGHNHWAYVSGLNDTSDANFPIIADGFAGGPGPVVNPTYTTDQRQYGGAWEGRFAIVVHCDGSATILTVRPGSLTMQRSDKPAAHFFTPSTDPADPWLRGCTVLNPLQNH